MAQHVAQPVQALQNKQDAIAGDKPKQQRLLSPGELSKSVHRLKNRASKRTKTHSEIVDLAYSSVVYQRAYAMLLDQIAITYGGRFAVTYGAQVIARVQTDLERNS